MAGLLLIFSVILTACKTEERPHKVLDRAFYLEQLEGFWLGQCIANWTGLITEMDKIGIPVDGKGGGFYTREDWGKPDQPNIWGSNNFSQTIGFVYAKKDSIWGADDDTDIEYIYQEMLYNSPDLALSGEQIREAWMRHIYKEEENFLWVSNQKAFDLMQQGVLPPQTSDPELNPYFEMIDAQLTTEIFGLYAPTKPKIALELGALAIQTTARENARMIAEFYQIMHALAADRSGGKPIKEHLFDIADQARTHLKEGSYPAGMYDFVKQQYLLGVPWEKTRDALNEKYQIQQQEGYLWATQDQTCNGCFAAGINFGASIISLYYGEGNLKETIKVGVLAGWDSDNPTATWGGLIGFMMGRKGIEREFETEFSSKFNIHRTRKGFPNDGIDTFGQMAEKGLSIVDRVVTRKMGGKIDFENNLYIIPE
ncbi:MAG: ADP-ribosylglycohydrolase family protein [Robiginitalea sp.]